MAAAGEEDWQETWEARLAAISEVLGEPYQGVYHAVHPFALGGQADVVAFPNYRNGIAYITSELSGRPGHSYADYELMICHRQPSDWGPNIISRLAPYTQEAYIAAGESMDIDDATPSDSQIKALVFDNYGKFRLFEQDFDLRLCIGITKAELQYKMDHGPEALLRLLKARGVYPFTDLGRSSVPLGP
jgi:hypothetical protein